MRPARWLACLAAAAAGFGLPLPLPDNASVAILCPVHQTNARRTARLLGILLALDVERKTCLVALLCDAHSAALVASDAGFPALEEAYGEVALIADVASIDVSGAAPGAREARHEHARQWRRRARLAVARNSLVSAARINRFRWTLWLDSDLWAMPHDLLRRLFAPRAHVVAPRVVDRGGVLYDKNSWAHTTSSRAAFYGLPASALVVQGGYRAQATFVVEDGGRLRAGAAFAVRSLDDLRGEASTRFVDLDAVGTACLLVATSVYAAGVTFAEALDDHLLESEAFGARAKRAGASVVADVETVVQHA
ncbi:Anp1-domain-containing protein [Pelagophyceae sp. CCMP2097]|nr:Anp1-domain-containing protein [Pelagophyceae sp. CCMP2097]|mmetsp:Transcript_2906/g.10286  ORF Transcript_2906/g.10286 Transcript_2906/m.10286 type:complete len:308 (-) Transcript_2906:51-974(-)